MRAWRIVPALLAIGAACTDYDESAAPQSADSGVDAGIDAAQPTETGAPDATVDADAEVDAGPEAGRFLWAINGDVTNKQIGTPMGLAASNDQIVLAFSTLDGGSLHPVGDPVSFVGSSAISAVLDAKGAFVRSGALTFETPTGAALDGAGDQYLTGHSLTGDAGAQFTAARMMKVVKAGGPLWSLDFSAPDGGMFSDAIGVTTNGLDVAASVWFNGVINVKNKVGNTQLTAEGYDSVIDVINGAAGYSVWTKVIGGAASQVVDSIVFDKDGNVLVSGHVFGNELTVDGVAVPKNDATTARRPFALRFAKNEPHDVTFAATIPVEPPTAISETRAARALSNGDVIVCGMLQGTTTFAGKASNQPGATDGFIARLGLGGSIAWLQIFGGSSTDECDALAIDSHDNIIAIVNHQSSGVVFDGVALADPAFAGIFASSVLKLDANGHVQWHSDLAGANVEIEAVTTAPNDDVLYSGYFANTLDLGDGPRTVPAGHFAPFVVRRAP